MSRWSPRPAPGEPDGLILFDGVCVFCSRWVRFVIDRDTQRRFRFVAIQGEAGRSLATRYGIDADAPQTNAVILNGRIWFKSDAALAVLSELPSTRGLRMFRAVPTGLRNPIYDLIAQNRYRIFGRTDVCMVPSAQDRDRFIA